MKFQIPTTNHDVSHELEECHRSQMVMVCLHYVFLVHIKLLNENFFKLTMC